MPEVDCAHEELNSQPVLDVNPPRMRSLFSPFTVEDDHPLEITACHYPMDFAIELFPNFSLPPTFH